MNQSNLLELARQGEPSAIAALMNAALEPKGVTAKVDLGGNCLYVVFESTHSLNPDTLIQFTYRGLQEMGTELVKTVKLYEQKIGENTISWKREFLIQEPLAIALANGNRQPNPPDAATASTAASMTTESIEETIVPEIVEPETSDLKSAQALATPAELNPFWRKYPMPLLAMVAVAFFAGGVAAFISTSTAQKRQSQQALLQGKQQEAETYLSEMNEAQRAFYAQNQRFASSLEDLERSANKFSQAYYYTYRLEAKDPNSAKITAIPKEPGLKSYLGAVFFNSAEVTSVLCQTQQPTEDIRLTPKLENNQIQCPEGMLRVP
jgi:Tfp pilus assembly protein PilE